MSGKIEYKFLQIIKNVNDDNIFNHNGDILMYSEDRICKNQIKIPWRLINIDYSESNGFRPLS